MAKCVMRLVLRVIVVLSKLLPVSVCGPVDFIAAIPCRNAYGLNVY